MADFALLRVPVLSVQELRRYLTSGELDRQLAGPALAVAAETEEAAGATPGSTTPSTAAARPTATEPPPTSSAGPPGATPQAIARAPATGRALASGAPA